MRPHHALVSSLFAALPAASLSTSNASPETHPLLHTSFPAIESSPLQNANYIFNAIHSSMRQWGSSLYHNGMSFFLASVPKGTQLYHGTHLPDPVNGTEWLAFEPEHALLFARPWGPPPRKPGDHGRGPNDERPQKPLIPFFHSERHQRESLGGHGSGWLHTYSAAKDLRLVYIDGMSAGKTPNGTLDSQERILLNNTQWKYPGFNEMDRARAICRIAREDWEDRIDGVIRMEAGFEIILCSFERDLELLHVKQTKRLDQDGDDDDFSRDHNENFARFRFLRAVAARYHGIGGDRVRLNYEHFVTAYNGDYGLDLFNYSINNRNSRNSVNDEDNKLPLLPRLNVPSDKLDPVRRDLYTLVMTHDTDEASFNWQAVTDMIIQRYADELNYLLSDIFSDTAKLHAEICRILEPFIDYSDRNSSLEIERCVDQFIPKSASLRENLAGRAIHSVTNTICSTLVNALGEQMYEVIVGNIKNLIDYLAWTIWKECRGCKDTEVCTIPMWPYGVAEDYKHPRCRNADNMYGSGRSYWGRPFH